MAPSGKGILHKQLEEQRFLHGIQYVQQASHGPKFLGTSELGHLNQILTGEKKDPWRFEAASVKIPSGQTHHFNVVSNPIVSARDVIGNAQTMAGNQDFVEAAFYLYTQLVLHHLFEDANRRTALLAVLWVLQSHSATLDIQELEKYPIGDLREPDDLAKLKEKFKQLITT